MVEGDDIMDTVLQVDRMVRNLVYILDPDSV